jgi:hypothetical protein
MIVLRCVALDSDAYPRLSWSSALLTDEGFYLHNARNRILFGHPETDQFNNRLIMPLLDAVQTGVFHLFGVSVVSARAISVVLGLLTLPVFFDALRRAFGLRTALIGLLLLGLDHVSLLYSRLALMDTPAAFVLVCAFWLWVRSGEGESGRRGLLWLALCGLTLGICYGVRGLGALVYPVPLLLLGWESWKARRSGASGSKSRFETGPGGFVGLLCLLGGLLVALGIYGVVWYLPNRAELTRVNHFYLFYQLIPASLGNVRFDITQALFGDERGYSSYLFRHAPVQFVLALLGLTAWAIRGGKVGLRPALHGNAMYLGLWLVIAWSVFGIVRYSPPRYYIVFYPALTGVAALAVGHVGAVARTVWRHRAERTLLGGFLTYHLGETVLHHKSGATEFVLYSAIVLVMFALSLAPVGRRRGKPISVGRRQSALVFAAWALINGLWLGDWLTHLRYGQRDADRWLAANLPPESVLIGDAAPGLCLNNRFVAVNVIGGLCNDILPLEQFASRRRYVVILDGMRNTGDWRRLYPDIIRPGRVKHTFPHLIHFTVTVYEVPRDAALPSPSGRKR